MFRTRYGWIFVGCTILCLVLVVSRVTAWRLETSHRSQIVELQNKLASLDKTVEVKPGVFEKKSLELHDLKLDMKDVQLATLGNDVKQKGSQLLSVTTLSVNLKEPTILSGQGKQSVTNVSGVERRRVEFEQESGNFRIRGFTLTDPAEFSLSLSQIRPLRMNIAVSQEKDGSWKTYATSSEKDVTISVDVSSVNPYIFSPRWYEKIGVNLSLGGGTGPNGLSALSGIGLSYRVGNLDVGPSGWIVAGDSVTKFLGVSAIWHPFSRGR